MHLERGELGQAVAALREAVREDPRDAAAHDSLGVAYQLLGMRESALASFEVAVREAPAYALAHLHLGLALDEAGRSREAIGAYEEALRLEPGWPATRHSLARACARLGDLDGAIRLLGEGGERGAEMYHDLGVYLWTRYRAAPGLRRPRDLDEAEAALREAIRLAPNAEFHRSLGQLLVDRQRLDEAVASFQRALDLSGGEPRYVYDLGLALRLRGDLEQAAERLEAVLVAEPTNGNARRALGLISRERGDLGEAARDLRRAVELQPRDPQSRNALGMVLLRLGDVAGAVDAFEAATRLDPLLIGARVNLAQALQRGGAGDRAREQLSLVRALKAKEAGVGRAMLALELAQRSDGSRAVELLREAVRHGPDLPEAHYHLGRALEGEDAAGAEAAFLRALALDPAHARARYHFGRLLARKGESAESRFQLREALARAPGLFEAHRELAGIAAAAGDWRTAVHELHAAVAWQPEDASLRRELAAAHRALGDVDASARESGIADALDRDGPARP